jgi:hypothetical protein
MTKPLTVVDPPGSNLPQPPRQLGARGLDLWRTIMAEYHIDDPGGRELLYQAAAALERAEQLAEAIAADGVVVHTRAGAPKPHPALAAELAARAFICRTLERLGLNLEAVRPIGRTTG